MKGWYRLVGSLPVRLFSYQPKSKTKGHIMKKVILLLLFIALFFAIRAY
jgi:hypothetical protein